MQHFSRSSHEWQILEAICGEWNFWSFAEVSKSLAQGGYEIFYIPTANPTELWQGVLFTLYSIAGADIVYVYVRSEHRSHGLGLQLLQELQAFLVNKHVSGSIIAEVRPSNAAAIALYEKFGMFHMSKRPKYYSDGEDALVYRKKIVAPATPAS